MPIEAPVDIDRVISIVRKVVEDMLADRFEARLQRIEEAIEEIRIGGLSSSRPTSKRSSKEPDELPFSKKRQTECKLSEGV